MDEVQEFVTELEVSSFLNIVVYGINWLHTGYFCWVSQEELLSPDRGKSTLCLKKVPTFELSVTLSNHNRYSNILYCWKAYEICYKTHATLPISP